MSKCWYCNNELTSDDSPKHFGICNKCYDKMFKSGDTIIRSLTNKISDLEAKLKALQNGIIDDETLNMLVKEHKLYKDLETKLEEKEDRINWLVETEFNRKWAKKYVEMRRKEDPMLCLPDSDEVYERYFELKQQLAEKDKEIEYQESMKILAVENQNKKAIEQLKKVKEFVSRQLFITTKGCSDLDEAEAKGCNELREEIIKEIDNQINELKGE